MPSVWSVAWGLDTVRPLTNLLPGWSAVEADPATDCPAQPEQAQEQEEGACCRMEVVYQRVVERVRVVVSHRVLVLLLATPLTPSWCWQEQQQPGVETWQLQQAREATSLKVKDD